MDSTAILNGTDKAKLEAIFDKLQFVENESSENYKCISCDKVAFYHYIPVCEHVYCGKCHGKVHKRQCRADGCQQTINQVIQKKSFEQEVAQLKVYCAYQKNGCEEEIPLLNYWEHHRACRKSTYKLLPKVFKEDVIQELVLANGKLLETTEELRKKVNHLEKQLLDFESNQGRTTADIQQENNAFKKMAGLQMSKIEKKNKATDEKLDKNVQDTQELNTKILQLEEQFLSFKNEQIQKNCDIQTEQSSFKQVVALQMEKKKADKEEKQDKFKNIIDDLQTKTHLLEAQLDTFKNQQDQLNHNIQTEQASFKEIVAEQLEKAVIQKEKVMKSKVVDDENARRWMMVKQNMENFVKEQAKGTTNGTEDLQERIARKPEAFMESESTEFTWKIEGITDIFPAWKSEGEKHAICSDAFALKKDAGTPIRAKMYRVHKRYLCVSFVSDHNNWSTHQTYKHGFCILDQSDNEIKRDLWKMTIPIFKKETEEELIDPVHKAALSFPLNLLKDIDSCYVKDDSVVVKIIVEPISISYNSYFSNNGKLLWKIDNFRQKTRDYIDSLNTNLYSEYFYSSEFGYRMVCSIGFMLSKLRFFLLFVKGQHDDSLDVDFPHTTTLSVLDQTQATGQHLTKTCDSDVARYEAICELKNEEIENDIYLKDDCLIIEVHVAPH